VPRWSARSPIPIRFPSGITTGRRSAISTDTTDGTTVEDIDGDWYRLHDCDGCGLRLPIGVFLGQLESKDHYNQRKYHDGECEALFHRKPVTPSPELVDRKRPRAAARSKALRRLGQMFPSKLQEFLDEEMEASP
jgi:hypothetical protein